MDTTTIIIIAGGVLLLLCLMLTIASFSGDKFFETYKRLLKVSVKNGMKVAEFIDFVNSKYLNNQVKLAYINRSAGEYYNQRTKTVAINPVGEKTIASFAIVAHELGHACQDIVENKLSKFNLMRKIGAFIGKLFVPIIVLTIVLLFFVEDYILLLSICGISIAFIIFLSVVIKARTIRIEKDATKKAIKFLEEVLSADEVKESKKLLSDARLTYWGDFIKLLLGWSGLTRKTKMFS